MLTARGRVPVPVRGPPLVVDAGRPAPRGRSPAGPRWVVGAHAREGDTLRRVIRREASAAALLVLVLVVFGAGVWATRNPDSSWLDPFEEWPVVGPWVGEFRESYRAPDVVALGVERPEREPEILDREIVVTEPLGAAPWVWALPGTPIRTERSEDAPVIETLSAIANLRRLGRDGDWFRVWRHGQEGWVLLPGYDESGDEPPLGSEPDPPLPLPGRDPDPDELAKAQEFLGASGRVANLGPYELHTDVDDAALLAALDRLASRTEDAYRDRYGLDPVGIPRAALVLFRGEGGYRLLQARSQRLFGLTSSGHTAYGLAVLYRGNRRDEEVAATLVHELVHLLNRRALGPALPPWLDEGLCDDLAFGALPDGRLEPSRLVGFEHDAPEGKILYVGAWGSLWTAGEAYRRGELPRLSTLLGIGWSAFVTEPGVELRYDTAALFVHYLLEGAQRRHREPFREFLRGVARGESAGGERLLSVLGVPAARLEAEFRAWLRFRADELTKGGTFTLIE